MSEGAGRSSSRSPRLLVGVSGLIALLVAFALLRLVLQNRIEAALNHATDGAALSAARLEAELERVASALRGLSLVVEVDPVRFAAAAEHLLDPPSAVEAVATVRNHEILAVYPVGAAEVRWPPLGQRLEAERSVRLVSVSDDRVFLATGSSRSDRGLTARLDLARLLTAARVGSMSDLGLDYELTARTDSGQRWRQLTRSTELDLPDPVRRPLERVPGEWELRVAPSSGWPGWRTLAGEGTIALVAVIFFTRFAWDLARRPQRLRLEVERRTHRLTEANRKLAAEAEQRQLLEEQLGRESMRDPLTGLVNRRAFLLRLESELVRIAHRPGTRVAVIAFDLDGFSAINRSLGQVAADQVLVEASRRVEAVAETGDLAARLGSDELILLLVAPGDMAQVEATARRVQAAMEQPVVVDGTEVIATACAGAVVSESGLERPQEVLRDVGLALHRARQLGAGTFVSFEPAMRQGGLQVHLEAELHRALEQEELRLYYQPILEMPEKKLAGFESLLRWQHPHEGLLFPGSFLSVVEASTLLVPVSRWCLVAACRQLVAWQRAHKRTFYISVNISAAHLRTGDVPEHVASALETTGADPGSLCLEITESVAMENVALASGTLADLKALGTRLFCDDFGTGYSSLAYLHHFRFDVLKIDRTFIERLGPEGEDTAIVRTILGLGRDLGMTCIAEGIETEEQLTQLVTLGCDKMQGYLFARPIPASDAEAWLAAGGPPASDAA